MNACFTPAASLARSRVYFRPEGTPSWYYVDMKSDQPCFSGVLPRPGKKLVGKKIEYYVEAQDKTFNPARTAEYGPIVVKSAQECKKDVPVAPVPQQRDRRRLPQPARRLRRRRDRQRGRDRHRGGGSGGGGHGGGGGDEQRRHHDDHDRHQPEHDDDGRGRHHHHHHDTAARQPRSVRRAHDQSRSGNGAESADRHVRPVQEHRPGRRPAQLLLRFRGRVDGLGFLPRVPHLPGELPRHERGGGTRRQLPGGGARRGSRQPEQRTQPADQGGFATPEVPAPNDFPLRETGIRLPDSLHGDRHNDGCQQGQDLRRLVPTESGRVVVVPDADVPDRGPGVGRQVLGNLRPRYVLRRRQRGCRRMRRSREGAATDRVSPVQLPRLGHRCRPAADRRMVQRSDTGGRPAPGRDERRHSAARRARPRRCPRTPRRRGEPRRGRPRGIRRQAGPVADRARAVGGDPRGEPSGPERRGGFAGNDVRHVPPQRHARGSGSSSRS